ncbi:MAG: hypothetical protein ACJ8AW_20450, partial [Rhodopila sp.]
IVLSENAYAQISEGSHSRQNPCAVSLGASKSQLSIFPPACPIILPPDQIRAPADRVVRDA